MVVNVDGINPWPYPYLNTKDRQETLKLGFYMQKNSILETGMLIFFVLMFYLLAHIYIKDNEKTKYGAETITYLAQPEVNVILQLFVLLLVYAELPLMILLLINSLRDNDFYHILLLFAYMLFLFNK